MKYFSMLNLIGNKYNKLSVIEFVGRDKSGTSLWKCICECGGIRITNSAELRSLRAKSCGCLFKKNRGIIKHGETNKSKEYSSWAHMKRRCYNHNNKFYNSYGARGIIVCERWINSFQNFLIDMGRAPSINHTLDRINVNGNYEPTNCRWATTKEQARNKRTSILITIEGVTKNVKDWCIHYGVGTSTVSYRLKKGYPVDKLFKKCRNLN